MGHSPIVFWNCFYNKSSLLDSDLSLGLSINPTCSCYCSYGTNRHYHFSKNKQSVCNWQMTWIASLPAFGISFADTQTVDIVYIWNIEYLTFDKSFLEVIFEAWFNEISHKYWNALICISPEFLKRLRKLFREPIQS